MLQPLRIISLLAFFLFASESDAQMALVQRTDLALGSDRKGFTGWLTKQGFSFDSNAQQETRLMAEGMSPALGMRLYGETYINQAGNIRIRMFTDTLFRIMQVQIALARPVKGEGDNFIVALKTIGYITDSRYINSSDGSDNCLLSKETRRFTIVQSKSKDFLLVKATTRP